MEAWIGGGAGGERQISLCMTEEAGGVMGTERSPVTHGFGLDKPNTDTDNYILWSSLLFSYE